MAKIFDATTSQAVNAIAPFLTERIPTATQDNLRDIGKYILADTRLANEFVGTLVNRIARETITSRLFENPLASFKKGTMRYGDIVEEIFVNIAKAHDFNPQVAENEVYKRVIPDIGVAFHQRNSELFYKVSISEDMLARAFESESGMRTLISGIVDSLYSGANLDEFVQIKNIFTVMSDKVAQIITPAPTADNSKKILTDIHSASNYLRFMSPSFNEVGVQNFTPINRQILLVRADVDALLDVTALATLFHLEKGEIETRKVMVDDFGEGNEDVYAALVDDEFLQVIPVLDKFTENYNGQNLTWNYFYHVWRVYSASPFANAVFFTTRAKVPATSVTLVPASGTFPKGSNIQFTPSVLPATASSKNVRITATGLENDSYLTMTGFLHIGSAQEQNITITATCINDTSVTKSYRWTASTGVLAAV